MRFTTSLLALLSGAALVLAKTPGTPVRFERRACPSAVPSTTVKPKVMIVSMFSYERAPWIPVYGLTNNITIPGLSPLYPVVACNHAGSICIVTTVMALTLSPLIDLTTTYWLIAGIAGINPYQGTLGTAAFARFAVQVALQYELDARQMPANWTTGYWALGTDQPGEIPAVSHLYGTEVFELNTNLLAKALELSSGVTLNDSTGAIAYRAKFDYAPANLPPVVTQCDVATSDVYYAGTLLSESFGNYTALMTNNEGVYCTTAQEDNASLESLVRAHQFGLADYARVVLLRTASDFDRAPNNEVSAYDAFEAEQGGFTPAIENLVIAGKPFVDDVIANWASYAPGIPTQDQSDGSFYGDDLGTIRTGAGLAKRRVQHPSKRALRV